MVKECITCSKEIEDKYTQCYKCHQGMAVTPSSVTAPPPPAPQTKWSETSLRNKDDAIALGQAINITGKWFERFLEKTPEILEKEYEEIFKARVRIMYKWIQELKKELL